MNSTLRDLAIELYNDYKLNPEDLKETESGFVFDRNDGKLLSSRYMPLTNTTSEEVYQWEVENGAVELCDMCKKVRCTCDDDTEDYREYLRGE